MDMQRSVESGKNWITGYGAGYIEVNHQRYEESLLLTPHDVNSWPLVNLEKIDPLLWAQVLAVAPELVLLGVETGKGLCHPRLYADLIHAKVGVETMEITAACRTFNILVSEERQAVLVVLRTQPM